MIFDHEGSRFARANYRSERENFLHEWRYSYKLNFIIHFPEFVPWYRCRIVKGRISAFIVVSSRTRESLRPFAVFHGGARSQMSFSTSKHRKSHDQPDVQHDVVHFASESELGLILNSRVVKDTSSRGSLLLFPLPSALSCPEKWDYWTVINVQTLASVSDHRKASQRRLIGLRFDNNARDEGVEHLRSVLKDDRCLDYLISREIVQSLRHETSAVRVFRNSSYFFRRRIERLLYATREGTRVTATVARCRCPIRRVS